MPLLSYLDGFSDDVRVFDWTCLCVGELLFSRGKATDDLADAIRLARRHSEEGGDPESIETVGWGLWVRRTSGDTSITAVAQLLLTLSRVARTDRRSFILACATPICLLERMESRRGETLDRVVASFLDYVGDRPARTDDGPARDAAKRGTGEV